MCNKGRNIRQIPFEFSTSGGAGSLAGQKFLVPSFLQRYKIKAWRMGGLHTLTDYGCPAFIMIEELENESSSVDMFNNIINDGGGTMVIPTNVTGMRHPVKFTWNEVDNKQMPNEITVRIRWGPYGGTPFTTPGIDIGAGLGAILFLEFDVIEDTYERPRKIQSHGCEN